MLDDSKVVTEENNFPETSPEIKNRKLIQGSIDKINESRPSTQGKAYQCKGPLSSRHKKLPYFSSKALQAYKVIKQTEAQRIIKKYERYERLVKQNDQIEIYRPRKQIQLS